MCIFQTCFSPQDYFLVLLPSTVDDPKNFFDLDVASDGRQRFRMLLM